MNKTDAKKVVSNSTNAVTERLTAGRYIGEKADDNYRSIFESEPKTKTTKAVWLMVDSPNDIPKDKRVLLFGKVKVNNETQELSVPNGFIDMKVGSKFSFSIDGNGYSSINTKVLTKEEIKALQSGTV